MALAKRIDVFCVGPQRTASSWLDRALRAHPNLSLPVNVKETFFFDRRYSRGEEWYLSHFAPREGEAMFAEVGSTYFESSEARERIRLANPEAQIIILVRNPLARSFSSYGHEYTKGRVPPGFFQAVVNQPRIVDSGRYSLLAPMWEADFGRERVLYIVQEDILANPQGQLDAVCNFMRLETVALPEDLRKRYGKGTVPRFRWLAAVAARMASALRSAGLHRLVDVGKRLGLNRVYTGGDSQALSMTRPIFEHLLSEHEADICFLEERLGRSFSHWRDPATYGLRGNDENSC